ncbi:MAG: sugar transferase [Pararhizobium sp.]
MLLEADPLHAVQVSEPVLADDAGSGNRPLRLGSKRAFDIVATLLLAPFALLMIAVLVPLIRLDGGKAFFCQKRIGLNGRIFTIWKLRSMVPDAETRLTEHLAENVEARAEWERTQKLMRDPRITWIGRYLRKFSIDELPQLWNVLSGDMSLVGPRPMFPEQRASYRGLAYFRLLPGLTGLWQVSARNRSSFADRAIYDTRYAETMSFATDMRILLQTVVVVVRGTGA